MTSQNNGTNHRKDMLLFERWRQLHINQVYDTRRNAGRKKREEKLNVLLA